MKVLLPPLWDTAYVFTVHKEGLFTFYCTMRQPARAEGRLHHERRGGEKKLSGPTKRGVVLVPEDWMYAWVPLLKQGRDS